MALVNLAGRDPNGQIRLYAIRIKAGEVQEYIDKAKDEGWTQLTTGKYEAIGPLDVTDESESSERPDSPPKNERTSSNSASNSLVLALRRRTSRRPAPRKR